MTTKADAPHLSASEVTAYVDGGLDPDGRARISAHLEGCAECRDEVGDVVRLLRAAPLASQQPRRFRWPAAVGVLLAASIAALILVNRAGPVPEQRGVERTQRGPASGARAVIGTVSPDDREAVPASGIVFTWRSTERSFYRITLTAADGTPRWSAQTEDTVISLPDSVRLAPDQLYFWYVDAVQNGIAASSGVHRFRVKR